MKIKYIDCYFNSNHTIFFMVGREGITEITIEKINGNIEGFCIYKENKLYKQIKCQNFIVEYFN